MKITPTMVKIANNHAERIVKSDLEKVRRDRGALDDAYDAQGVPADILEADQKALLDAYKKSYDPALLQDTFDSVRKNILEYAESQPAPSLAGEPCYPLQVTVTPVFCSPWYHHVPFYYWDSVDYEATERKAQDERNKKIEEWKKKMIEHSQQVIKSYEEALGLNDGGKS